MKIKYSKNLSVKLKYLCKPKIENSVYNEDHILKSTMCQQQLLLSCSWAWEMI